MNKEILDKYLSGACSPHEFEEFAGWVILDSSDIEAWGLGFAGWKSFKPAEGHADEIKYNRLLDKIHHKINLKAHQPEKAMTATLSTVTRWFSRAAAFLFLPLLGAMLFLLSNNNIQSNMMAEASVDTLEVIAPIGSRTVVQLTDGTRVNLNYGSRIRYPRVFSGKTREILLIGEGYFNVAHNPDKPFIVNTGKLNIKVFGTEFNVQSYPGDDNIATTLVNGKVTMEVVDEEGGTRPAGSIKPGQHVEYNIHSGKVGPTTGNIEKYIAWKDDKLVFDNEPITGVAVKLSRMFNVDIQVAENIKDLTYTVTFVDEPLFLILDLMTETTPIKYTVSQRKKLPDGTYSKQQIKIEKRK